MIIPFHIGLNHLPDVSDVKQSLAIPTTANLVATNKSVHSLLTVTL